MKRAVRIVKLGGSLLSEPALVDNLRRWLSANNDLTNVLIVGGGALVDAIERLSTTHRLEDKVAHWLCIDAMRLNAQVLHALLPEATLTQDVSQMWQGGEATAARFILDPKRYLHDPDREHPAGPLPETWDVTSDSIAARLAEVTGARELVLLKSALPSTYRLTTLADNGFVDRYFPQAAARLDRIRCVDLRSEHFAEVQLQK